MQDTVEDVNITWLDDPVPLHDPAIKRDRSSRLGPGGPGPGALDAAGGQGRLAVIAGLRAKGGRPSHQVLARHH